MAEVESSVVFVDECDAYSLLCFPLCSLRLYLNRCWTAMGLLWFPKLVLMISAFVPQRSLSCPSGCRCYSLTVECGSLGIKEVPHGIPSITEVSLQWFEAATVSDLSSHAPAPFGWLPFWSVRFTLKRLRLINSLWPAFDVNLREGLLFWPSNYSLFLTEWLWHTPWSSVEKMFNNVLFFYFFVPNPAWVKAL